MGFDSLVEDVAMLWNLLLDEWRISLVLMKLLANPAFVIGALAAFGSPR
jgi:hypothetical protein